MQVAFRSIEANIQNKVSAELLSPLFLIQYRFVLIPSGFKSAKLCIVAGLNGLITVPVTQCLEKPGTFECFFFFFIEEGFLQKLLTRH